MDVYTSNTKELLPDDDISDSDDENIKLVASKKKEPVQKSKINIPQNKSESKVIPQNDVPQLEQPEKNKSFVTFEEQHASILTNKNLLR